jgi:hypothetical protein
VDNSDRIGRLLGRLYLTLCIVFLAATLIHSLPDHQRQAAKLRLLRLCALATTRLARRTGAASMGRELATGEQLYHVPYRLSVLRDRLAAAYDRAGLT